MATFTSKKEIVTKLKTQISEKDDTAIHALLFVYAYQEASEQDNSVTSFNNGVGFNKHDAEFCTSLVNQYNERGSFSRKQLECIKSVMQKYAGQIVEIKLGNGDIVKNGRVYSWTAKGVNYETAVTA